MSKITTWTPLTFNFRIRFKIWVSFLGRVRDTDMVRIRVLFQVGVRLPL